MAASASQNNAGTAHPNFGGSYAIAESEVQANTLGSAVMKPGYLKAVQVTLTAAQVLAMNATPVQLLAAVANQSILVHSVLVNLVVGASAFAGGGPVVIENANTAAGAGTATTSTNLAAASVNSATTAAYVLQGTAYTATIGNGLFVSNQTGAFTGGTGSTLMFTVYYSQL